jgi:hypothetical protein
LSAQVINLMLPDEPLRFGIHLMGNIKRPL